MPIQLDDFNTGAASALGSLWTTGGGYAVSADGYAYTVDTRNPCAVFTPGPSGADQFVERKFANNTSVSMGVLTRASLSGNSVTRGYLARHNGSQVAIMRASNGSFSQIGQANHTRAAGQTLRLESIGNQHTAFIDGVQIVTVTDSTYLSGGSVGMRDGGTADSRIDSMRGGDYGVSYSGTLSLTGSGTSSVTGSPALANLVPLLGTGDLTAGGSPGITSSVPLSGVGSSAGSASLAAAGALSASASGHTTHTGTPSPVSTLPLAAVGVASFAGSGYLQAAGRLDLTATGSCSFHASPALSGTAGLGAAGSVAPSGAPHLGAALYLDGDGQLVLVGVGEQVPAGFTPYRVSVDADTTTAAIADVIEGNRVEVLIS